MQKKSVDRDAARRRVILDAARGCILKFGYAKSSLEDIAVKEDLSQLLFSASAYVPSAWVTDSLDQIPPLGQ